MSRRESPDLRELLAQPTILELPTVCDPLGARTAVAAGFAAVTLPGFAVGAHLPGDTLLGIADVQRAVRRVADAAGVPVLLDLDTGWVPLADLPAAVRGLADAGAAAIRLSGLDLVPRVRAAAGVDAVLTVRCAVGTDMAVARVAELVAAGAEAVLVDSTDEPVLRGLPTEFPDTWLIHATSPARPGRPAAYPVDRLATWGYAGVANQYHRCYCARLAPLAAGELREPHVAGRG